MVYRAGSRGSSFSHKKTLGTKLLTPGITKDSLELMMKTVRLIQFKSLAEMQKALPTEKKCLAYLEKILWPNGVVSPYDPTSKVYKRKDGTYRCKNTGKNFNVKVGTIFENTIFSRFSLFSFLLNCELHFLYSALIDIDEDEGVAQGFSLFHRLLYVGHLALG